ncbi:hypothetical protein DFJ66_0717 [Saccharothrix variisporea]|uniref:Uncharacterized protein n=1 Tax=Saccharothrix variisporea TaxID=543527 RepID=A0A495X0Q8_9PSEU|nr:hypothetical protein DFJ66_0717 [Saccharothrix variisporea]
MSHTTLCLRGTLGAHCCAVNDGLLQLRSLRRVFCAASSVIGRGVQPRGTGSEAGGRVARNPSARSTSGNVGAPCDDRDGGRRPRPAACARQVRQARAGSGINGRWAAGGAMRCGRWAARAAGGGGSGRRDAVRAVGGRGRRAARCGAGGAARAARCGQCAAGGDSCGRCAAGGAGPAVTVAAGGSGGGRGRQAGRIGRAGLGAWGQAERSPKSSASWPVRRGGPEVWRRASRHRPQSTGSAVGK